MSIKEPYKIYELLFWVLLLCNIVYIMLGGYSYDSENKRKDRE